MDDIDWSEEPFSRQLVQVTPYDFARQVEARWRDTTSEEEGTLAELSARPGATWEAAWAGVRCVRLSDGTVFMEPLPGRPSLPGAATVTARVSGPTELTHRQRPADLLRQS